MSTAEERFDLVIKSVESVRTLTKDLHEIGIYDSEEYKASEVLLRALNRAMYVLDPDRADEYVKGILKDALGENVLEAPKTQNDGLYL